MSNIQKVSHLFKRLFQIAFYILPIYVIFAAGLTVFGYMHINDPATQQVMADLPSSMKMNLQQLIVSELIMFSILIIQMYIIRVLINLFSAYERMDIFSVENTRSFRKIGLGTVYLQIVKLFSVFYTISTYPIMKSFVMLTMVAVSIKSIIFSMGLALMIILISWIMSKGYEMREDLNLTV